MKEPPTRSSATRNSHADSRHEPAAGPEATAAMPPAYGIDFLDRAQGPAAPAGLPAPLKAGVESLSGLAMDDVRVHYHSPAPARLEAQAYTQGTDIHLGPGQERHLAHEAWHVVQQKQGRAPAAPQLKGGNPDAGDKALEHEADAMGQQAAKASHATTQASGEIVATGLTPAEKQDIIDGKYADRGQYQVQSSTRKVKEKVTTWKMGTKTTTEVEKEEAVVNSTFTNQALEKARQYLDEHWAGGIDITKASGGGGDTKGKHIPMPGWVYEYQNKLAAQKPRDYKAKSWEKGNNPNWNDDSFLAQRVLEAFLRAWHKQELPEAKDIPSNIEELYKRAGVSEKAYGNAQAQLLGDPNVYGWCGPASYNAVVMGLFRNGLRFRTGREPMTAAAFENRNKPQARFIRNSIKWANKTITEDELNKKYQAELSRMALLQEVNAQAAFFIGNDTTKSKGWLKGDRFVSGKEAYANYPLKPGDIITQALMNGSPVSGHVLTVVKEERNPEFKGEPGTAVSKVYGISGNAGSIGGGSVKIEQLTREMPPPTLKSDLNAMSALGNRMTVAVDDRKRVEEAQKKKLSDEQKIPPHKLSKEDVEKATNSEQGKRRSAFQADLAKAEEEFKGKTDMSYTAYLAARNAKNPSLAIITIGRTHQALIARITTLRAGIRAIDDFTAVPEEAKARKVAYSPSLDPRYSEQSGNTGRFRPNELGHMWITTIIKASEYADGNKIKADLNLDAEAREKKIKEMGWDANTSPEKYQELVLDKHGMEKLPGSVESLWPGAIAAIEGEGLAKQYK
jgi:hypothetical protein